MVCYIEQRNKIHIANLNMRQDFDDDDMVSQ